MVRSYPTLLFEVSAEVCFKMGGIHTVIKSKAKYTQELWGEQYCMIGAYMGPQHYNYETLETIDPLKINNRVLQQTIQQLQKGGWSIRVGIWKIEGNPLVLLLDPMQIPEGFDEFQRDFQTRYVEALPKIFMLEAYLKFGYCLLRFFETLTQQLDKNLSKTTILAHFQEYMVAASLPQISDLGVRTIFTTHSTVAGRSILANDPQLFQAIQREQQTYHLRLKSGYLRTCEHIELQASKHAHVFTTVSEVTAKECNFFLGRYPDFITPNGLNLDSLFKYSKKSTTISRSVIDSLLEQHFSSDPLLMTHPRYYFVSSGRYEYIVKGYDLIVAALAELNQWLKTEEIKATVVMFFITDTPWPIGNPLINTIRRSLQKLFTWLSTQPPKVFLLKVPGHFYDNLLIQDLFKSKLNNQHEQRVKTIVHPQFMSTKDPVFKMDYLDFLKACDLGVFPSLYEPWGYTAMESILLGKTTIASNCTGFVEFMKEHNSIGEQEGFFVIDQKTGAGSTELFEVMKACLLKKTDFLPLKTEQFEQFDWSQMIHMYERAYQYALQGQVSIP